MSFPLESYLESFKDDEVCSPFFIWSGLESYLESFKAPYCDVEDK